MGSLGGVVASRIAREFQIGGPSFSISCDENSGIQALAIAADWLARNELDAVVVGAVDFAGDIRTVLARAQLSSDPLAAVAKDRPAAIDLAAAPVACDGAVCLIVKRLDDALRDGDRVGAVIRRATTRFEQGAATSSQSYSARNESIERNRSLVGFAGPSIGYLDIQAPYRSALANSELTTLSSTVRVSSDAASGRCAVGSILDDFGQMGAAAGLAAVAKAAVCLEHEIIPAPPRPPEWLRSLTEQVPSLFVPGGRQFWLRNRVEGVRCAAVRVCGLGGVQGEVVLEEFEPSTAAVGSSVQGNEASGARTCGIFMLEAGDQTDLAARIEELTRFAGETWCQDIDTLARRWWHRHPGDRRLHLATAIVADGVDTLKDLLQIAVGKTGDHRFEVDGRRGSIHAARPRSGSTSPPPVAFVYPGLGCHFAGMGRELSAIWPDVLRRLDAGSGTLRDQLEPALWWGREPPPEFLDHRVPIVGSVWAGSLVTEILRGFGVNPRAAIGYSMGESTALVALRAWTDRDLLLSCIRTSPLFRIDLAGPCEAARRCWDLSPTEPVDWVAGVVSCSAESVEAVVSPGQRVYVLIRNSADETVIGGERRAVDEVVEALRSGFVVLPHVSTVHCEIGRIVEADYRALHDLETSTPAGIDFYSGVWGHAYALDRHSAADAITAQAAHPIDFAAVIERAYRDGVQVFLEVGPGGSCTRLIDRILADRPHRALSACRADREPFGAILEVLAALLAERVPVDLAGLYGSQRNLADAGPAASGPAGGPGRRTVRVEVRGRAFSVPQPRRVENPDNAGSSTLGPEGPSWSHHVYQAERATAEAHRAFLRTSQHTADLMGRLISLQLSLLQSRTAATTTPISLPDDPSVPATNDLLSESAGPVLAQPDASPFVLGREQCLEFAVGSIASVLGPDYAPIDRFPTRVRLPDEPLFLVDRILAIEGRPRSLEAGRIVTEHVVRRDAWYLDGGKVPPCIAIEAGQADLFLSAYLGADFVTEGQAVYRLLDATVTFHRGLPGPGDVIRYDIRIDRFFRQGNTMLFRFQFDATVLGEPLLTMRDGCAGFFSAEELAAGKGIVRHKHDPRAELLPPAEVMADLVSMTPGQLDERQLDALRGGDLATAFGSAFAHLAAIDPLRLPVGRMARLASRRASGAERRPSWAGADSCGGRDPAERLVPGVPLRQRSGDAGHAHVRVLSPCAAHSAHENRLGRPARPGCVCTGDWDCQSPQVPGASCRVDGGRGLRSRDQGGGLPAGALCDRRRAHIRRWQADRRGSGHGPATLGKRSAEARAALGGPVRGRFSGNGWTESGDR